MDQKIILETIGTIEKKELLGPVNYDELVLETSEPFPGYHGDTVPESLKPRSLFVITRSKYTEEKIIRVTQKIKRETDLQFDGSPGLVTLYNMLNPCVRIKDMNSFDTVTKVIQAYKDEGIEFMSMRKIEPFTGTIKVKKYFLLEVLSDWFFKDVEDPNMHYFSIPIQLRFNQFEKMTLDLKRSMDDHNFDAALGTIFRKTGLLDIIRIYDDKCTPERIDMIRSKYMQSIGKLLR